MDEISKQRISALFPRASRAFIDANSGLFAVEREPDSGTALGNQTSGEEKGDARPVLSIVMYRVRLLDKENAYGATKCLTDCLCQIGLIPGDREDQIDLQVTQKKVAHLNEQRTEVKIVYPNV